MSKCNLNKSHMVSCILCESDCTGLLTRTSRIILYILQRHHGKETTNETKLRIHNIRALAALKFGSGILVLKKRAEKSLQAAQMKFFRHLLGITKLDIEKNQSIRKKLGHKT
jgi:hypothetical protein